MINIHLEQFTIKHTKLSLPLLFTLNDKFPNNSKIVSRLGKTLSNQVFS